MKKLLQPLLMLVLLCIGFQKSQAQTYDAKTSDLNITGYGQTFAITCSGLPTSGLLTSGSLYMYYTGDFGTSNEYIDIFLGNMSNFVGRTKSNAKGLACQTDTTEFRIPPGLLSTFPGSSTIVFYARVSNAVDPYCSVNKFVMRLKLDYCSGTLSDLARVTSFSDNVCPGDGPFTFSGLPTGGTWSGPGVSNNQFDAARLAAGSYTLRYSTTSNGCDTYIDTVVTVKDAPMAKPITPGCGVYQATLETAMPYRNPRWYSNKALSNLVSSGPTYTTPNITQETRYYLTYEIPTYTFKVDTFRADSSNVIDHEFYSGDDRAGIAVSDSFVYVVGDYATARYDLDLTPSSAQSLPIRDGLFSDLITGKLYTFYDKNNGIAQPGGSAIVINAIRSLNSDLSFGPDIIPLDRTLTPGSSGYAGIFAGAGYVVFVGSSNNRAYKIDLATGATTDIGFVSTALTNDMYGSEGWAVWGVAEYDGAKHSLLYRSWNTGSINRYTFANGTNPPSSSLAFPFYNLGETASFTYSMEKKRWYFHHEGYSQFGGNWETLGYAKAAGDTVYTGYTLACARPIIVPYVKAPFSLGNDTVVCLRGSQSLTLTAMPGASNYTWNGTTSTSNTFQASANGDYTVLFFQNNCGYADTIKVTIDCTDVADNKHSNGLNVYPNPNNGSFVIDMEGWNGDVTISIADIAGRAVSSEKVQVYQNYRHQISLQDVPSGVYMLKVASDARQAVYKIQVTR